MESSIVFTEEEKYILKSILESFRDNKAKELMEWIGNYIQFPENLDEMMLEILNEIYEKLMGLDEEEIEKIIENTDWNSLLDEDESD